MAATAWRGIADAGRVAGQGAGTRYGISDAATKTMIDYLLDGAQWMDRGDSIDPLATGREISRAGTNRKALSHTNPAIQALAIGNGYRAAGAHKAARPPRGGIDQQLRRSGEHRRWQPAVSAI